MKKIFDFMMNDNRGATAIEYALIAAGISIAVVAAVGLVGGNLSTFFDGLAGNF